MRRQISELCAHLGGIPLGLELAASLTGVFSPEEILSRLKTAMIKRGAAGRRDAPSRHATLQAAIDWSYQLLSADQRVLFAGSASFWAASRLPRPNPSPTAPQHICWKTSRHSSTTA